MHALFSHLSLRTNPVAIQVQSLCKRTPTPPSKMVLSEDSAVSYLRTEKQTRQSHPKLLKLWEIGKAVCFLTTCSLASLQADEECQEYSTQSEQEYYSENTLSENTENSQEEYLSQTAFLTQVENTNHNAVEIPCSQPEPECCTVECCEDPCSSVCCQSNCCDNWWSFCPRTDVPWESSFCFLNRPFNFYLRHTEGRWLDLRQGYTTLGFFGTLPVCNNSCLYPFIDLRGHIFNNGRGAASAGIGLRYLTPCWYVVGFNVFFDYRRADWRTRFVEDDDPVIEEAFTRHWRHSFEQVGVGFEFLGPYWEFRANGYFPVGNITARSPVVLQDFGGGLFSAYQRGRKSAYGGDLEIGTWLLRQPCCWLDFFGAIGTYYFSATAPFLSPGVDLDLGITQTPNGKRHRNIWGIQGRIQSHLGNFITAEVRAGYDHVYKGSIQFAITLTNLSCLFNFGSSCRSSCNSCNSCCCCVPDSLYQPVRRQEVIVLGPGRTVTDTNFPVTPFPPPIPSSNSGRCRPDFNPCYDPCDWGPCEPYCNPYWNACEPCYSPCNWNHYEEEPHHCDCATHIPHTPSWPHHHSSAWPSHSSSCRSSTW